MAAAPKSSKAPLLELRSVGGTPRRILPARLAAWALVAGLIVTGVVMFFRYGTRIAAALI